MGRSLNLIDDLKKKQEVLLNGSGNSAAAPGRTARLVEGMKDSYRVLPAKTEGKKQNGFVESSTFSERSERNHSPFAGQNLPNSLGQMEERQAELKNQLTERENSGDMGGTSLLRKEYDRISNQLNALQKEYKDNFFGQFGASYTQGRLSQDSSGAWNDYLTMPTEENRKKAENLDAVLKQFQERNKETLKDDAKLPWLSQSLAGYLPQFVDQTKATVSGGLIGAGVGSAVPVLGTLTGAKAGATAASGLYSYNTMRGSAFRDLLKLGFDEETARAAANDEAVVSALIEMGDTLMDVSGLSYGAGNLVDVARKGLTKTLAKEGAETAAEQAAKKLLKGLGRYGLTVGSEMAEEGAQQAVSIANKRALKRWRPDRNRRPHRTSRPDWVGCCDRSQ